jgi:hypothetical protein
MSLNRLYNRAYRLYVKHNRYEIIIDLQYMNESGLLSIISSILTLDLG